MNDRNGEKKLRAALNRLKLGAQKPPELPEIQPKSTFEFVVIERLDNMEERIAALETRVNWLLVMVAGASLSFILKTVFS